jgi:hypothetical protein
MRHAYIPLQAKSYNNYLNTDIGTFSNIFLSMDDGRVFFPAQANVYF